jgi:nicotinate-nucleotide adenylyltransferase
MEFFQRARGEPRRLGILPGAFNPITLAHLALARAALDRVDEVVFVLPRVFPHKNYAGASLEQRVDMVRATVDGQPALSIAVADGGLFVEIARECRAAYGEAVHLAFLCGRDAAERIVGWDYGRPGAFADMLREFELLVAARHGSYDPPPELAWAVRSLSVPGVDAISATEVRERAARGEPWAHLVPEAIVERARAIYESPTTTLYR